MLHDGISILFRAGAEVNCLAYWFIAPYIRDIPHLHNGEMMQKLIPATPRGTMGRTFLTGDTAFKARWGRFVLKVLLRWPSQLNTVRFTKHGVTSKCRRDGHGIKR